MTQTQIVPQNKSIIQQRLSEIIKEVENKQSKLFFFVPDTKGKPMASVKHSYNIAKRLVDKGYRAIMLHDKKDYYGVKDWLGEDYANMEHLSFEDLNKTKNITIKGCDIFVVPEVYGQFIKELYNPQSDGKRMPSETIVLCQNHVLSFEEMMVGEQWRHFGVETVIATSGKLAEYMGDYQRGVDYNIINPVIEDCYFKKAVQQKPMIMLCCRNPKDAERVTKMFYQKYPMYGWIGFKALGTLSKEQFAREIQANMLAVWIDDHSTFGTFPLECMASNVPVIVKIPDLIPEWAENTESDKTVLKNNAIYVDNILTIPDMIAEFSESWLLGNIPDAFYGKESEPQKYSRNNFIEQVDRVFENVFARKIKKLTNILEKHNEE